MKGLKKLFYAKDPKEAEVVMLILDKIDFKTRLLQKTKMDII